MKKVIFLLALFVVFITGFAYAGNVRGYYRKDGTYVNSYQRSTPNRTVTDNYSFKGNSNPYTGKTGDNYYKSSPSSPYYNPSVSTNTRSYNSGYRLKGYGR